MTDIPKALLIGAVTHFERGIPIDRCGGLSDSQKARLARVDHVYWQYRRNPFLDVLEIFKMMHKGTLGDPANEYRAAMYDKRVLDYVINNISFSSRKDGEIKVRAAADRLMKRGMETDNGKDLAEGAKIRMKLDRLDQPESEQADMTKISFLPPVVVTDITAVDDTKEYIDDEQALAIMNKYGAYVDDKRKMIEARVATLEASGVAEEEIEEDE